MGLSKTFDMLIHKLRDIEILGWCPAGSVLTSWFSGSIVPPDSKETELGSSDQEASPSAGKNTGLVLVPFRAWECVPTAISSGVDISEVPGCHLLREMSSH